jgi:hypothetical protein
MRHGLGLILGAALLTGACGKKQAPEGSSIRPATSVDRLADGQALAKALTTWKERWAREPLPPSCDAQLVKAVEDRKLCDDTAAALTRLQERVKADAPAPEVLKAASELALTGSHAERRLRMLAMEYLATQGASASAPASGNASRPLPSNTPPAASTAGASAPPNPSSRALPGLAASAMLGSRDAAHSMVRSLSGLRESGTSHGAVGRDNPYQPLVRGYSKLSVQGLRFLGTYLEKAPLPLRTAAAAELERLNLDHQPWHQVAQVARQAALLEQTPELKKRLGKLDPLGGAARQRPAPK